MHVAFTTVLNAGRPGAATTASACLLVRRHPQPVSNISPTIGLVLMRHCRIILPGASSGEVLVTREKRRLAAIVAADVVGYSRLMGRDESGTLARLKTHRTKQVVASLRQAPSYVTTASVLVACYAQMGRLDDAREVIDVRLAGMSA
jgi:hypothetical protein